jgi:hypothetical protein
MFHFLWITNNHYILIQKKAEPVMTPLSTIYLLPLTLNNRHHHPILQFAGSDYVSLHGDFPCTPTSAAAMSKTIKMGWCSTVRSFLPADKGVSQVKFTELALLPEVHQRSPGLSTLTRLTVPAHNCGRSGRILPWASAASWLPCPGRDCHIACRS